jgi:septal ring factor EnvC (AmiA/AmiB activator)
VIPVVPPRAAADRAQAVVGPLATAGQMVIIAGLDALVTELQRALAAAYEEVAEHRAEAEAHREHAEADHAALQRVGELVVGWSRYPADMAMYATGEEILAAVAGRLREAIDGSQEGSHGEEQGQQAGGTGGTGAGGA